MRLIALEVYAEMEKRRNAFAEAALERELAKTPEQIEAEMAADDEEWEAKRRERQ